MRVAPSFYLPTAPLWRTALLPTLFGISPLTRRIAANCFKSAPNLSEPLETASYPPILVMLAGLPLMALPANARECISSLNLGHLAHLREVGFYRLPTPLPVASAGCH